jgi:hypothetical protein
MAYVHTKRIHAALVKGNAGRWFGLYLKLNHERK